MQDLRRPNDFMARAEELLGDYALKTPVIFDDAPAMLDVFDGLNRIGEAFKQKFNKPFGVRFKRTVRNIRRGDLRWSRLA